MVRRPCPICGDAVLISRGDTGWLYKGHYYHVECTEGTDLRTELVRGRGRIIHRPHRLRDGKGSLLPLRGYKLVKPKKRVRRKKKIGFLGY